MIKHTKIKIEQIKLNYGQIDGLPANPRFIKDAKFEKLVESIRADKTLLEARGLIVYKLNDGSGDYIIIGGEMRYRACVALGFKEVPCHVLPAETTAEQLRKYTIQDNAHAGEFDYEALANEWDAADLTAWGVAAAAQFEAPFNFDSENQQIDNTKNTGANDALNFDSAPVNDSVSISSEEESTPLAEQLKTEIKIGDIIKIGSHVLVCGSSTESFNLDLDIENTLVFTDPPYGISSVGKDGKIGGGGGVSLKKDGKVVESSFFKEVQGDDDTQTARLFYENCIKYRFSQYAIFGGNYFTEFLPAARCWYIWDKENGETTTFADAELIYTTFEKPTRLVKYLWNGLLRKGYKEIEGKKRIHPNQKPVGLISTLINRFKRYYSFNSILDGFAGGGSIMVAAEINKIKYVGYEIDPLYCQLIIDRMTIIFPYLEVKVNNKNYTLRNESLNEVFAYFDVNLLNIQNDIELPI